MPNRSSYLAAVALLVLGPLPSLCADSPAPRPVSVQEISLLLRSGYTGDEVLRETANRPLLAPLDAAAERALRDAGADARTIDALKTGHAVVSSDQAAEAQRRQAEAEQHRLDAWAASQQRQLEANRQAVNSKLAARHEDAQKATGTHLQDKLVVYKDSRLQPYDGSALPGKRLFLIYAAALRVPACHQFTPKLIKFYEEFISKHPECEVVMVSDDRSAYDMETSMRQDAMPWPALAWDQKAKETELAALPKGGVPRLVLIDGTGTMLADSTDDGHFNSKRVLDALVAQTGGNAPVASSTR